MDGQMDEWKDRQRYGWTDRWTNGQTDGWVDRQMAVQMDGETNRYRVMLQLKMSDVTSDYIV